MCFDDDTPAPTWKPAAGDVTTGIVQQLAAKVLDLEARLAAAEALLREAVECGEWFDGTFHIEMNADWLDKAKEVWR